MKVHTETRDLIKQVSRQRGATYDDTIQAALAALQREDRRTQLRLESAAAMADPQEQAEMAAVLADMEAWSAR